MCCVFLHTVRVLSAACIHVMSYGGYSCLGLPTEGNSRLLFTCEKGYVATQSRDTNAGGGVHHNTRCMTPTPDEEYVAIQDS